MNKIIHKEYHNNHEWITNTWKILMLRFLWKYHLNIEMTRATKEYKYKCKVMINIKIREYYYKIERCLKL